MTSIAQKTGDLMLHGGERGIAFRDTKAGRIQTLVTPHYRHTSDYSSETSASTSSADGVYLGRSVTYYTSYGTPYISITLQGHISSGTYYWAWGLYNGTQSHWVPIVATSVGTFSVQGKTRTISTIQGNQTMNCAVAYRGAVHQRSSQPWVTFDCRNETNGDALYIYGAASSGGGDSWYANSSQTIYIREVLIGYGPATGIQYDHVFAGS